MLIVLLDDRTLYVFPSAADVVRKIEALDAEEIRAAFDDSAVPYEVEWLQPNRPMGCLFGFLGMVQPGEYRLVPSGPPDPASLIELLEAYSDHTNPREAKAELTRLLTRLRAG